MFSIKWLKLTGLLLILSFSLSFQASAQTDVDKLCEPVENSSCCMASLRVIKEGNFKLAENGRCPKGYRVEMQRCIDSLQWCIPTECNELGQGDSFGGVPPPGGWPDPACCEGLVDREPVAMCDLKMVGGYTYVCIRCGDGTCDSKFESRCNCPEDCPVERKN